MIADGADLRALDPGGRQSGRQQTADRVVAHSDGNGEVTIDE